jgi:endoglucanase
MRSLLFFAVSAFAATTASCLASGGSGDDGGTGGGPEGGVDAPVSTPLPEAGPADTGSPVTDTGSPEVAVTSNGYTVKGPTIYDSQGNPHLFHGVDRPSLEFTPEGQAVNGTMGIPIQDFVTMATTWKANVVRVSLNQDYWLPGGALYASGYKATVQTAVTNAEAAGLDVILDLHWSDCGNAVTATASAPAPSTCPKGVTDCPFISGQQVMGDKNSVTFWQQVAAAYMSDPHVLFELYNEPNGVPVTEWLSGGSSVANCPTVGMQALYNAVRGTGAQNLVIIGGLNFAFDLSGVVPGLTNVTGTNIIYATHPYNEGGKGPTAWPAAFGNLTATYPVMITEFGDTTACSSTYNSEVIAYANKTGSNGVPANEISWSAYGWWAESCTFPSLLAEGSLTAPSVPGMVVQTALLAY